MIYIKEKDFLVKHPQDKLSKDISNILYQDLQRGYAIITIPDRFDAMDKEKNVKKTYKVGFLYDMLTRIYPEMTKTDKYRMISERYHFWFTYRQFVNIILDYEASRELYLNTK